MKHGLLVLFLLAARLLSAQDEVRTFHLHEERMGSSFVYTVEGWDSASAISALKQADAEVARIEALISSWQNSSETSRINQAAGQEAVVASEELFQLIVRSIKVSGLTDGAFDISYAGVDKIWKYDGTIEQIPDSQTVDHSVRLIGYGRMVLNETDRSVFLPDAGMKIGFGAIGKGYAADRAATMLRELGFDAGVVNAGGDLICWGSRANGKGWQISIADPVHPNTILASLDIRNMAVVTSGNYEKFIDLDGIRYSHIIDPRTGWPVRGIRSVTVISPIAEFSDALATGLFVMGVEEALSLVNQIDRIECLIITDDNEILTSKGLDLELLQRDSESTDFQFRIGN